MGGRQVRDRGWDRGWDPPALSGLHAYPVCLPQALLPPPALVLPDEPGGGALLRGAAQPGGVGVLGGGGRGGGGSRRRVRAWPPLPHAAEETEARGAGAGPDPWKAAPPRQRATSRAPCPHVHTHADTPCAHAPPRTPALAHRLVLSSSSESMKLLDSSSLLSTVDVLSGGSPRSRRRSPLGCPLVRAAVGTAGMGAGCGVPWRSRAALQPRAPVDLGAGRVTAGLLGGPLGSWNLCQGTPAGQGSTWGSAGAWGAHGVPGRSRVWPRYPPRGSDVGLSPAGG